MAVPERLAWAVKTLAVDPADRVLEIGCGRGVAVDLVCDRLVDGTITAVDRSEKAIDAARRRNARNVAAGKAVLSVAALEDGAFEDDSFDKIFAVNVNLFWSRSPAKEMELLKRWPAPGGGLYLFYEPPGAGRAREIAEKCPRRRRARSGRHRAGESSLDAGTPGVRRGQGVLRRPDRGSAT
ncbi:class I SAM-dependent methyltransferase [Streptosporangium sp. G11]|uniref:class I SAM-dependent methyltransferase n=1 Tax=Streptosporangium sp. G11 TaxID=3436926 RepID=UPI003EC0C6E1